jgi:hypothetical protein
MANQWLKKTQVWKKEEEERKNDQPAMSTSQQGPSKKSPVKEPQQRVDVPVDTTQIFNKGWS